MKGGLSFVTLMVLNPIIILFYQNCSVVPASRAEAAKPVPTLKAAVSAAISPPACKAGEPSCPK